MTIIDYFVLALYFISMAVIGLLCMLRIKKQEDYFLGGRSFGKILQAFAAFGAGTGANDPVTLGKTTYTSGLSGIWSVLLWLFATPFYWIFGVWYRRMRHITLGDWFVERYESKALGVAYALFAVWFYINYLAVAFSAVGKVCAPLMGTDTFNLPIFGETEVLFVLLPIIALVVLVYGVLGGLSAAYWTDLLQGIFIILLSVILIPAGLQGLVDDNYDDPTAHSRMEGFEIMHERVPAEYFEIVGGPRASEFPIYFIIAITLLNLSGIVVQPHFIATGGGSAKTETNARVGLVVGNFLKRFCTVGWALTGLIVLALLADNAEIARDPDRVWGVAAREILGPMNLGLVGLMLACLLAALMSSADCYMLVASGLIVRNFYAPYIDPNASERTYVTVGRVSGTVIIVGAVALSLANLNVFEQLKSTWEATTIFFAAFWIGMFWRRATKWAAWITVVTTATVFFILPLVLPHVLDESFSRNPRYTKTNHIVTTTVTRKARPSDVSRRSAEIKIWEADNEKGIEQPGPRPVPIAEGDEFLDIFKTTGKAIYWSKVTPVSETKYKLISEVKDTTRTGNPRTIVTEAYDCELRGSGIFKLDFILYDLIGVDLESLVDPMLETLRFPPKIITPLLLMVLLSFVTPRNSKEALDRYYVKMKTPVEPDPEDDDRVLDESYRNPDRFNHKKLFPNSSLEFQKPTAVDIIGFVVSFAVCFGVMFLAWWLAQLGS